MNKITQSIIDRLTERSGETRLTIYMPTHRISTPATMQEDQTRYKNLVRKGFDEWREHTDNSEIQQTFELLESKYADESFWDETTRGLAIFADKNGAEFYHLPVECEEHVCVGSSYDLTPIHIAKNYDQQFYVLALAMHNSKLFKGDAYGLESVEIDFPKSPEDALNIDEMFNNSNTQRGYEGAANSNYSISMHGVGDSSEAGREERLQYFRIIDAMLSDPKYVDTSVPILVAATDSEAGDYKAHSRNSHVMESFIPGNYTRSELHALHEHAWPIVHEEFIDKKVDSLVEKFNEQKGINKASSDVDDIREAVEAGRVDSLLVCMLPTTNDTVSDASGVRAPLIRFSAAENISRMQDLIERVVAQGGKVIGVDPEKFTIPSHVGALYRY